MGEKSAKARDSEKPSSLTLDARPEGFPDVVSALFYITPTKEFSLSMYVFPPTLYFRDDHHSQLRLQLFLTVLRKVSIYSLLSNFSPVCLYPDQPHTTRKVQTETSDYLLSVLSFQQIPFLLSIKHYQTKTQPIIPCRYLRNKPPRMPHRLGQVLAQHSYTKPSGFQVTLYQE